MVHGNVYKLTFWVAKLKKKKLLNRFWIQNLHKAWISVVDHSKEGQTYNIKNFNPGLVESTA